MGYFSFYCILIYTVLAVEACHLDGQQRDVRQKSVEEDAKQQTYTISDLRFLLHEIFSKNGPMTFGGFKHWLLESVGVDDIIITDHGVTAHSQEDALNSTNDTNDHPKKEYADHNGTHEWLYAFLAVLAISLCGFLSVAVIPIIMQKSFYQTLHRCLVGLAVASLLGDAFMHLLPHAMMGASEWTAVLVGFAALSGFILLAVVERLLAVIIMRKRPSQEESQYRKDTNVELSDKKIDVLPSGPQAKPEMGASDFHGGHGHSHEMPESTTAVALMVIMGEMLHSFCDGLTIATAFVSGIEGGISTTIAVFCHELPHKLGDYAMLLKTGTGARRVLLYNALSAVASLSGMALGLYLRGATSATGWIFAVTAGCFIKVAAVDMLPQLSLSYDRNSRPLNQLAVTVIGFLTGASIMLIIALYEQDL